MRNKQHVVEMEGWKYGSMEAWKDSRIAGWKDGSAGGMEGWDGPSRPPYFHKASLSEASHILVTHWELIHLDSAQPYWRCSIPSSLIKI